MRLRALAASGGSARRYFGRKTLVAPLVALAVLTPAPAIAADGSDLIGHRCRTGDSLYTKENTVAALRDVSTVPGAMCEIDVWRLSDGTNIVWHDPTWERVADPATLPDGVDPTDPVTQATSAQVSQIRTKGGQPVARLGWMIRAAGEYDVPLIVEIQNSISGEEWFVDYARQQGTRSATTRRRSATAPPTSSTSCGGQGRRSASRSTTTRTVSSPHHSWRARALGS
jgi:hypothetical protein